MTVAKSDTSGTEPNTLEGLFAALEEPLLRYAWRFLQDSEAAQDVVQEAFMKLHHHFDTVKTPRSWLFRTVHNLALNQIRAGRKLVNQDFAEGGDALTSVDADPLPDEHLQRMEAIGQTRLLIEELDERSRELIRLKFEEELSYKEMAVRLKISVGNVGFILSTTLKRIGESLEKTGGHR